LGQGTASGLRGGIAKIRNVIGSLANDILVGNKAGDLAAGSVGNQLDGGAGRDVLIAGAFLGTLLGGDDADLLIGGTTAYDADPDALEAVMAEWSRTDIGNTDRANNLRGGLLAPGKATSNGKVNSLMGNRDVDLFFGALAADADEGEIVVPI